MTNIDTPIKKNSGHKPTTVVAAATAADMAADTVPVTVGNPAAAASLVISQDHNQNTEEPKPPGNATPDPFDPERWRRKAAGDGPQVKRLLTTVPTRTKPVDDKFVRVHPDPRYRFEASIIAIKDEGDFLVLPDIENVVAAVAGKMLLPVTLFTAITYAGDVFLWVAKYPASTNHAFARWPNSMREAIELAMTQWVRVESNTGVGAYVPIVAEGGSLAEPKWPDTSFGKLLNIAFAGRQIDRPDHPLINRLRGIL